MLQVCAEYVFLVYNENDLALDTASGKKYFMIKDQCAKCDIEILYTKIILGKQGH